MDLRAVSLIRNNAIHKSYGRIMSLTSRDNVAAEAHYHASCYTAFVNDQPLVDKSNGQIDNHFKSEVDAVYLNIYVYIRDNLFSTQCKSLLQILHQN